MSKDFEYYCDKSTELLQRLEKELDEEKAYIASKGAGAIFSYAAEYVQNVMLLNHLTVLLVSAVKISNLLFQLRV